MNGWMEGIQRAITYIEENITEELDIRVIAGHCHVSAFHFQRLFSALCGVTVGEYIRNRRLTLAAQALLGNSNKVIDIAFQYGYDSPDAFARAFTRFHGITPSAAMKKGAKLRAYAPLHIKISMEGGTMLEYKIVEKDSFTVMGKGRKFNTDTGYEAIPKFWQEHLSSKASQLVCGMYGICMDSDGKNFDYLIADNYLPWNEVPDGFMTKEIPAGTWAVFPCHGALPKALQDVNTKVWSEWVPNCTEYRLGGNYSIELYAPLAQKPEETYCEIWIPVVKL